MSTAIETLFKMAPRLAEGAKASPGHVMVCCPFHGGGQERTPSLSISTWKPVWFCLAGETRVLTRTGSRPIKELAGEEHEVLVPGGYWVKAPIKQFGEQRLWEITLSRNGITKVIRATAEHRWFLRRQRRNEPLERTTAQLEPRDVLDSCFPVSLASRADGLLPIRPSAFGIARGFVYGDGTALKKGGSAALSLLASTVPVDFFLLSEHRRRFVAANKEYERRHWQVVAVRKTRVVEPVYCAVVPHESHAFTLEDNILTGNCHGCKASGHLAQLMRHYGIGSDVIESLIPRGSWAKKNDPVAAKLVRGQNPFKPTYVLDERVLDAYRLLPTGLKAQGFTVTTMRHFEVGYDTKNIRITYPLRTVHGELAGISGRAALEGVEPRYKIYDRELKERSDVNVPATYTMEETKSSILWHAHVVRPMFFLNQDKTSIILTEGFKACMWVWQSGHEDVVALVGSYLTKHHAELIARATREVTLFLDNNEAGYKGTGRAGRLLLSKGCDVRVAAYPDDREQPDDLSADEISEALTNPKTLRAWVREHPRY